MTTAKSVLPAPPSGHARRDRGAERLSAQETLWRESSLERVRKCGRVPLAGGLVAVKASGLAGSGRFAGFGGLMCCGSTWACPCCSAKIAATRKSELQTAMTEASSRGWSVTMVTLTMRHHKGQALAELWDALAYAWGKRVVAGRAWQSERASFGVQGIVKLVEATHGRNGWHVHVHALVFTDGHSRHSPAGLGPVLFQRWREGLVAKGLRAPAARHGGLHVRTLTGDLAALGEYFTKGVYGGHAAAIESVALEVARGDLKDARFGNRTPFAVLADVVRLGEASDLELWHEWEQASHGRRQLTWSRGLRAELVAEPELSDEEVAAADEGGDVVLLLDRETWRTLCAERGARHTLLTLAALDNDGGQLRAYLTARGLAFLERAPDDHAPDAGGPPL